MQKELTCDHIIINLLGDRTIVSNLLHVDISGGNLLHGEMNSPIHTFDKDQEG